MHDWSAGPTRSIPRIRALTISRSFCSTPATRGVRGWSQCLIAAASGLSLPGVPARATSSKIDGSLSKKKVERYNLGLDEEASQ